MPFTERFFDLACTETATESAGYVGLITTNSFMKREFGKALIEKVIPSLDLTHVLDTSGAYIPGHGTPTVILFRGGIVTRRAARCGLLWAFAVSRGPRMTPRKASYGIQF